MNKLGILAAVAGLALTAVLAASSTGSADDSKLEQLKAAEVAYNEATGVMSTCEMRMPPTVTSQGGRCAASR